MFSKSFTSTLRLMQFLTMAQKNFNLQAVILISFFLHVVPSYSFPLSTQKTWIIDDATGQRVKLACVNWPSHIGPMLAEGLDRQPLNFIASQVVKNQFNCVRFTWATYMYTRANYAKLTVAQSLDALNLTEAKAGIAKHNAFLLRMTVVQAFGTVVDVLGANGLMVVLDNHISQPIWCCGQSDGNGFHGDPQFHPEEWLRGLSTVAKRFKGKSQVIGIGLRNELRGPRQNSTIWYRFIEEAAREVHELNPDVLVIASGLDFATDLSFLKTKPLGFNLDKKLVLEAHSYSWSSEPTQAWEEQPVNEVCARKVQNLNDKVGFVVTGESPVPLFFGEFGINQKNVSRAEDRFLSCFLAYIAERDLDWSLWALQGTYYYREGKPGTEEYFGILDANWDRVKNPNLLKRLQFIQRKNEDVYTNVSTSNVMYHPRSGSCVHTKGMKEIHPGTCKGGESRWTRDGEEEAPIKLVGSKQCLKAVGDGKRPILSNDCSSPQSIWKLLSPSKLHLAARNEKGQYLCLHMDSPHKIVTRKCICVGDDPKCKDDPTSQWFKLVPTNVK